MKYSNFIVAFDLDGTLLNSDRKVSEQDLHTLKELGNKNKLRVVATGRNFFSVNRVLPSNFPVDFVVFSSGAGIMNWKTKEIIYALSITQTDIKKVISTIMPYKLNFTVNMAIPNNHHMLLYSNHPESDDLIAYTSFYKDFLKELNLNNIPEKATQIIALLNSHKHLFNEFKSALSPLKCILTTSPINHTSMWLEVFHPETSKGNGLKWLSNYLGIKKPHYFAIGNDYNDLDMLQLAQDSFVVANAPKELKLKYRITKSNNESGFSHAINSINKLLYN